MKLLVLLLILVGVALVRRALRGAGGGALDRSPEARDEYWGGGTGPF
jgi:hypothetical protein